MAAEQGLLDGSGRPGARAQVEQGQTRQAASPTGIRVHVGNPVTSMHTRVPRYVRNHEGTVVTRSCVVSSHGVGGDRPSRTLEHIYAVEFAAICSVPTPITPWWSTSGRAIFEPAT